MKVTYDEYYLTENLFGAPYPELIDFFAKYPDKGKVLDLGCGQGRDAIALARMGYNVTGIDHSKIGIEQMNHISRAESLNLIGQVGDVFAFHGFSDFDFVLLDSMFHFAKKDKKKEIGLIQNIVSKIKTGCLLVICIQDSGKKVQILNQAIDSEQQHNLLTDKKFNYAFEDEESGHKSESKYRMIIIEKQKTQHTKNR